MRLSSVHVHHVGLYHLQELEIATYQQPHTFGRTKPCDRGIILEITLSPSSLSPAMPPQGQEPEGVGQRAPSDRLGPAYRSKEERPKATVSTKVTHENVTILPQTPQLIALLT